MKQQNLQRTQILEDLPDNCFCYNAMSKQRIHGYSAESFVTEKTATLFLYDHFLLQAAAQQNALASRHFHSYNYLAFHKPQVAWRRCILWHALFIKN